MKKYLLCLLLIAMVLGCCACTQNTPAGDAPTASPTVSSTGDAALSQDKQNLIAGIRSATQDYASIVQKITAEHKGAYNAQVPLQNAERFIEAVEQEGELSMAGDVYAISLSTKGNYTYEKPYADITSGENTDTYVISDDESGTSEEIENTYYDPMAYLMSGAGGGDFAYASYYLLSPNGDRGEYETISRLNDAITGYAHFEYVRAGETLYFADAQLNLAQDQTEGPYTWAVLVGEMTETTMDIFEYTCITPQLALPEDFPAVREQGTVSVKTFSAARESSLASHLTLVNGTDLRLQTTQATTNIRLN